MKTLLVLCCVLMSITLALAYAEPTKPLPFGPTAVYQVPEGFPSKAIEWPSIILAAEKTGDKAGVVLAEACDPEGRACALFGAFVDQPKNILILIFVEVYFVETKINESYVHEAFLKTGVPDYRLTCRQVPSQEELNAFKAIKTENREGKKWPI